MYVNPKRNVVKVEVGGSEPYLYKVEGLIINNEDTVKLIELLNELSLKALHQYVEDYGENV